MALPLSSRARIYFKTAYKRITLNRLTAAFLVFGILHCFAQGIIHAFLFTVDAEYSSLLNAIVSVAQVPRANHTHWDGVSQLEMCNYIPHTPETCSVIFDTTVPLAPAQPDQDPVFRGKKVTQTLDQGFQLRTNSSNPTDVTIMSTDGVSLVTLDQKCISMLVYPAELLHNYKREDLTLVFFQFWLLAMSMLAMMNDSVPHVLANLVARVVALMWGMYTIYRTQQRKHTFWELIEQPGTPCSIELFTDYDATRFAYEIPDLVLNVSALGASAYLSWTLHKVYSSQFFTCLGTTRKIARLYKYFMAVQACLHLESFVLLTAMGLWIDQLLNSYVTVISEHDVKYRVAFISTTAVLVPWLIMGYFAIRKELKVLMVIFLILTLGLIGGWASMFYSQVYRWTFRAWPFLGGWIVASFMLLIATVILGIISWRNFGQGLREWLHAESRLAATDFKPSALTHLDVEKAGVSWEDPHIPPLKKLKVESRPRTPPETNAAEPVPTFVLPALSRTPTNSTGRDSIASFYPEPRSPAGNNAGNPKLSSSKP